MAVRLADAVAFLSTNDDDLKSGLADGERQVSGWGSAINGALMGAGMAAFNMVAGVAQQAVGYVGDSLTAASDLSETVSKINTLFGDSSGGIMAWAETSATAMGLPKQAALDAVGTIGNLFMQLGAGSDEAASTGQSMVQLSADLASFHNVAGGSSEVLDAMTAAFRGEYDALQRYIPTINAAAVEQQALAMTGKSSADELTNLDKAMATQAIMARDAGAAIGDFARTSDGAANQQRILDANMANLQATLGKGLLPVWGAIISVLNQLVQQVMPPVTAFITERMVPAMDAIGAIIRTSVQPMIQTAMSWFNQLGSNMRTQTDGPFAYLRQWFEANMPRIQQIVQTVLQALTAFWNDHGARIMEVVNGALTWIARFWDTQMRTILDVVQVALQLLTGDWEGAGETLRGILGRWKEFLGSAFEAIISNVRTIWTSIDWGAIGKSVLDGIANGIRNGAGALLDAARDAANGLPDAFKQILGIASPSKVAAVEIGEPFSAGVGVGIRNGLAGMAGDVNAGLQGLLRDVRAPGADGLLAGLQGLISPMQAAPAGSGPINITINVSGGDAAAVGAAAKGGVLQALRQAGVR